MHNNILSNQSKTRRVAPNLTTQHYDDEILLSIMITGLCAGLLITGSLVRTHSGACFTNNFASLSPLLLGLG